MDSSLTGISQVENSRSWQEKYEQLRQLHEVALIIHSTLEPGEALHLIVREAVRLVRASSGSVVLLNPTSGLLEIQAAVGLPAAAAECKLRTGQGITGWVALTGKVARVGNVGKDPRYVMLRHEVRSELAVPLTVHGKVSGVLNVDSDRDEAFSQADEDLLVGLADQAARVIENTWRHEQLRLKAGLFEALARVSRAINSTLNLEEALAVIAREACALMKGRLGSVMLLDREGKNLMLRASYGAGPDYASAPPLSVDESLMGTVVRRRKPVQVFNVQASATYQRGEVARREGLVSLLSMPLVFAEEAIGTLNVYTGEAYVFSNEEVRTLAALAELSAVAIAKARLYEKLVDAEEQLRQNERLSALGLLAAEVAHEIRNPLTVMKMLYHSLDLRFDEKDPRTEDARIIGEKMDHLNRIVEQILDLARTTEPQFQPVNVNEIIEELALLVRHKLQQQHVELRLDLSAAASGIMGDAGQLEQAFLNLMLNAAEAMPSGGRLSIATRIQADSGEVLVVFEDTGKGMTPEQCRQAFKAILKTTKAEGTGLGLAIVARVIEMHRGEVSIDSVPGQGSKVKVALPGLGTGSAES